MPTKLQQISGIPDQNRIFTPELLSYFQIQPEIRPEQSGGYMTCVSIVIPHENAAINTQEKELSCFFLFLCPCVEIAVASVFVEVCNVNSY